jgi:hypothetical protein
VRKRVDEGWTSLETLVALFIVVIASAAISGAASAAARAGEGLARRVEAGITASNGDADEVIGLYVH